MTRGSPYLSVSDMLYFILAWTGLLSSCLVVGCYLLHRLQAHGVQRIVDRAILSAWLGLSSLAILLLLVAIFMPLSPLTGAGAVFLAMLLPLRAEAVRNELAHWGRQLSTWDLLGYSLCCVVIAAFMNRQVTWIDTGLYHAGLVHWFAQYGIAPGLALLNPQFGFVSAWFAMAAPLNPTAIGGGGGEITVMNGFVLLLTSLQTLIISRCILSNFVVSKQISFSDWFLTVFSLIILLMLTQSSFLPTVTVSASPDVAIALLTVVVAWSILLADAVERAQQRIIFGADFIPVVLAAAAFSTKLTSLPLMAVAAGFYLFRSVYPLYRPGLRRWVTGGLLNLGLLLPSLTAQVLASGCPLYPSTAACLALPWRSSTATTEALAATTHGWGAWFGQPPASANGSIWLLQQWLHNNQLNKLTALLIIISCCGGLYLLRLLCTNRLSYGFFWLLVLGAVGTTFMMLKAPLFRFGMSYVLLLPVLMVALLCDGVVSKVIANGIVSRRMSFTTTKLPFDHDLGYRLKSGATLKLINFSLVVIVVFCVTVLSAQATGVGHGHLSSPPPLPTAVVAIQEVNGIPYAITQDDKGQCWSAQLPCVKSIHSDVSLRNPALGLKGGFVRSDSVRHP